MIFEFYFKFWFCAIMVAAQITSISSFSHKQECTEGEDSTVACLNEGKCFVVEIGGQRIANCQCPSPYKAPRCQEIDPILIYTDYQISSGMPTAGIIATIVVGVLLLVAIVCIVIWRRRYLNKKKRETDKQQIIEGGGAKGGLENVENKASDTVSDDANIL